MYKEEINKHEAILKAMQIAGITEIKTTQANNTFDRIQFLTNIFTYFKNALHNSPPAKEYLKKRGLDYMLIETGYNSGQYHHGTRKDETLIQHSVTTGLLMPYGTNSRSGGQAYKPFGKNSIVYALRNKAGQVTGLYFRSTINDNDSKHYYLKNRCGLYPKYPKPETKKLIIPESIIDTATLLQIPEITANYSLLASYGTNGITQEHKEAIKELKELEEIVLFFDGDEAGRAGAEARAKELKEIVKCKISIVNCLEGEDINSLSLGHSPELFTELLNNRKEFSFSNEKTSIENKKEESNNHKPPTTNLLNKEYQQISIENKNPSFELGALNSCTERSRSMELEALNIENSHNLHYQSPSADYYIKGGLRSSLDSMKISIQIVNPLTHFDHRAKADLYEYKQVESLAKSASQQLSIEISEIKKDLSKLTHLLEQYRNNTLKEQTSNHKKNVKIPEATINQCLEILQSQNPIKQINQLIGKSGVTGEENNRIFLFVIASSYKMPDTLHALIQGSSGSGKTMLLKTIYDLMPSEDSTKFTRVTDSSFYNYPEHYFVNRLVCFEDIDGLKEDALYAVRELISNELLVSSTSIKTESGQITGAEKTVRGPIASISCTTKGEIYEDNMSRVFLIAVDESHEQTKRIIQYQQQKASGTIDRREEKKAKELLQNSIRLLKPCEVINPFASKIQLPEEAHKIRRLNDLYLSFVKQVTLLNQYQRKKDKQGRLITEPQDLQTANEIMFDSIILKIDELDGSLRNFYEKLKKHVQKQGKDYAFSQREIRQTFRISKTSCQNYINTLLELEYIQKTYISKHNTYNYKISHWDSLEALRERIKTYLDNQLKTISDQKQKVAEMVAQDAEIQ
jgi:DNA primase/energy-coupling factor transporter ATP-binding protein EcfA2